MLLREWSAADIPRTVECRNDPQAARFLVNLPTPHTRAHAEAFLAGLPAARRAGGAIHLAVADQAGRLLGAWGSRS